MSEREIIAYAITHAPRGQKGGPYWATVGGRTPDLRGAVRYPATARGLRGASREADLCHARVIRIVRARPSEAPATSAVQLLNIEVACPRCGAQPMRECVEGGDGMGFQVHNGRRAPRHGDLLKATTSPPSEARAVEVLRELAVYPGNDGDLARIQARARRVLASAGPDPMPVVRAALRETEAEEAFDRVAVKGRSMNAAADAIGVARANRVDAVDAYRKAGGK